MCKRLSRLHRIDVATKVLYIMHRRWCLCGYPDKFQIACKQLLMPRSAHGEPTNVGGALRIHLGRRHARSERDDVGGLDRRFADHRDPRVDRAEPAGLEAQLARR